MTDSTPDKERIKTLHVPILRELEDMEPCRLAEALDRRGAHDKIDIAPWAEFPYKPEVAISVAASLSHLFVKFNVEGKGLKAEFGKTNEPVWQDSCVEFFIADPDGNGYRNFEINCTGTLLCAHQERKGVGVKHISEDEAARILRHTSVEKGLFAEKEGDFKWDVAVSIPWDFLGYESIPEDVRVNFYKCADGSRWPHYLCWAPITTPEPDFHRPEFFGKLIFHPNPQ